MAQKINQNDIDPIWVTLAGGSGLPSTPASGTGLIYGRGTGNVGLAYMNATGAFWPIDLSWTDYSASTIITGWSSTTDKVVRYLQIGKTVFVEFRISGTSNGTSALFTVPIEAKNNSGVNTEMASGLVQDNGSVQTNPARVYINASVDAFTVRVDKNMGSATWTGSGTKDIRGIYIYEAL